MSSAHQCGGEPLDRGSNDQPQQLDTEPDQCAEGLVIKVTTGVNEGTLVMNSDCPQGIDLPGDPLIHIHRAADSGPSPDMYYGESIPSGLGCRILKVYCGFIKICLNT